MDFSYQNPYIFSLIDREVDLRPLVTTIGEDSPSEDGMEGGELQGVIITRADSSIRHINGLKNKRSLSLRRNRRADIFRKNYFFCGTASMWKKT